MATETEITTAIPVSGALRNWEIGLIVANGIVVVILLVLVGVGMVCFVTRRRIRPDILSKKQEVGGEKSKARPVSMIEQIQLMEEEVEEVDFGGESLNG